ncbi:MAG: copper chaperone [Myxococcota bacterium]|jgi:copper chaperone
MLRSLVVLSALALSPVALACGGKPCGENCNMPTTVDVQDVQAADGSKVVLAIAGMHCGKCADKVAAALRGLEGVTAANVDIDSAKAQVAFDAEKVTLEALIAKVAEAGHFTATKSDS